MPQAEQEEPRLKRKRKVPPQFIIDSKSKKIPRFTKKKKLVKNIEKQFFWGGITHLYPHIELVHLPYIAVATNTRAD